MVDSGARIVVTLDADGQHRPEEMERLVGPVADGTVDIAHGSRVLGHAEPNHVAREMGIIFFNRARVADHAHEGVGLLERLPRGARVGPARSSCCARSSSTPPSS